MVTTRLSAAPSLLACLMLMSVTSGKSHKVCSSWTNSKKTDSYNNINDIISKTLEGKRERQGTKPADSTHNTNLVRVFQLLTTPLDATVCSNQNDELSTGRFPDLEGLRVEGFLQGLHADEVLELEVACCGSTLTELLDEALEAEADSLACQEVAVLDLSSHVFWQEGFVAKKYVRGKIIPYLVEFKILCLVHFQANTCLMSFQYILNSNAFLCS